MKQCKACNEMYDLPHPTAGWSEFRFFGNHCPIVRNILIQV